MVNGRRVPLAVPTGATAFRDGTGSPSRRRRCVGSAAPLQILALLVGSRPPRLREPNLHRLRRRCASAAARGLAASSPNPARSGSGPNAQASCHQPLIGTLHPPAHDGNSAIGMTALCAAAPQPRLGRGACWVGFCARPSGAAARSVGTNEVPGDRVCLNDRARYDAQTLPGSRKTPPGGSPFKTFNLAPLGSEAERQCDG